jgi:hypothetical protein
MFEIVSNGLNFFQIVSEFQSFSEENGLFPSNVYEVNPWLWQFGHGRSRLGGLTVQQTTVKQAHASEVRKKRGADTRWSRRADQA